MRMNKLLSFWVFSLLLTAAPAIICAELTFGPGPEAAGRALDAIVAVVENDVITQRELDAATARITAQLQQRKTLLPPRPVLEAQVLERLILSQLQLRAAERQGIVVDDATLNTAIENLAQHNKLSLTQLRQKVERDGINFTQFRDEVRRELLSARLRQKLVDSQLRVSEQDVDSLATQSGGRLLDAAPLVGPAESRPSPNSGGARAYRIAQILIALPEQPSPSQITAAQRQAEEVLAQLRQGADFAQMARRVSASQAAEGGEIGWRLTEQLPTLFSDVAPKMQPGEISALIRSPSGFHIVKLLEVRGGGAAQPLNATQPSSAPASVASRDQLREALLRRRSDEEWALTLRRLRDEAYVEVRPPYVGLTLAPPASVPPAAQLRNGQ
ncbi:MAG: peptidylprolyl isomerase [Candidatus Contendobacter sp.]